MRLLMIVAFLQRSESRSDHPIASRNRRNLQHDGRADEGARFQLQVPAKKSPYPVFNSSIIANDRPSAIHPMNLRLAHLR
jgi:hypothetical protein